MTNAIQFIKDHGVEKARGVVEGASEFDFAYDSVDEEYMRCGDIQDGFSIDDYEDCFLIEDLKRLVESVGLVGKVGGISQAKAQVKQAHEHGYLTISIPVEINGSIGMGCLYIDTLEKAIADYESIYGGEHV